jgi:hypothetical protein
MIKTKLDAVLEHEQAKDSDFRLEQIFEFLLIHDGEDKDGYEKILPHQRSQ